MVDYTEIPKGGELWELFARDLLEEIGFYIESSIDRGPDGKKDLIVSENLNGYLGNYKFRWLVSCKHFANRANSSSVKEVDEPNILERVKGFNCDGFLAFYSTVPSSGLNTRLNQLKAENELKDYRVFDYKTIENYLITIGYSKLLMRYFPKSYKQIKPLHLLIDSYIPLNCKSCGKDILQELYVEENGANIVEVHEKEHGPNGETIIKDFYWVCKTDCDDKMSKYYWDNYNLITSWEELGDLLKPTLFLRYYLTTLNQLNSNRYVYSESAFKSFKEFLMALSQKVLREMTEDEMKRAKRVIQFDIRR